MDVRFVTVSKRMSVDASGRVSVVSEAVRVRVVSVKVKNSRKLSTSDVVGIDRVKGYIAKAQRVSVEASIVVSSRWQRLGLFTRRTSI